jgi:glucokinase
MCNIYVSERQTKTARSQSALITDLLPKASEFGIACVAANNLLIYQRVKTTNTKYLLIARTAHKTHLCKFPVLNTFRCLTFFRCQYAC